MGFFDELKRIARPYEDEEDDFDDFDDLSNTGTNSSTGRIDRPSGKERSTKQDSDSFDPGRDSRDSRDPRRNNKVVNIHTTTQIQVVLVKPDRFDAAAEIADHLREKRTVVLNLEQTNKDMARRILDFLSGVAYALEGKVKKVAISTYLITPYNVDILGDLIDELESNGLYF